MEKVEVIGLGQACVDFLGTLGTYPHEDGKVELSDLQVQCGGPASTALVTLSRLGVPNAFLGSLSDDPFGKRILENLQQEHVDVSCLKITPGYSSQVSFIAITKGEGKRTIFWHRGSVPHLGPADVNLRLFKNARVLHVDSLMIDASIEAARQAKSLGMTVVMDAGTIRQGAKELVPLVDILIASETFSVPLVGYGSSHETALHALHELGSKQVVITLGAKGSIGLNKGEIIHQKIFPVSAVDTTGAGDVYHGGYIYGLLQGWNMHECMRFASAAAALKCTKIGAQSGIPDLHAIHNLIRKPPRIAG